MQNVNRLIIEQNRTECIMAPTLPFAGVRNDNIHAPLLDQLCN